jgi:glycosyltransferase involved in cell wall biosynthesis
VKLLIVDPNVSHQSPSMKGVVRSLPALQRAGFKIELWCWHCDPDLAVERVVRLPRVGAVRLLGSHAFGCWARLRAWWIFHVCGHRRPDVIYSVAWYLPSCDICHVHFSPWDWERRQQNMGALSLRGWLERTGNRIGIRTADRFLRDTPARRILCVSNAVAADVRALLPALESRLGVLPNSYDASRFHSGVRNRWRTVMRQRLSYQATDCVFIFVSAGHYRRKGLFLAVEAIEVLRTRHPGARLLVVGGGERRLGALRSELDLSHPRWREFVQFTGTVPDVESYFAASDALLFPSYSEAFALVEIEAAACGLPLFLTRHHGSEMILQDGANGRCLEFDPPSIAEVLAEFVSGAWKPSPAQLHRVPDSETYARLLTEELLAAASTAAARAAATSTQSLPSPA